MKIINTEPNHRDSRGLIVDLLTGKSVSAITFISFTPGAVRGNHYHEKTTQWNYVIAGRVRLVTQFGSDAVQEMILCKGDLVETPPNEKHALVGIEDAEMIVFTEGPRGGKDYELDTIRLKHPLVK